MSGKLLKTILSGLTPPKIRPQEGVVVIPEGTSLFHGTTREAAESILSEGVLRSGQPVRTGTTTEKGLVFMSPEEKVADFYRRGFGEIKPVSEGDYGEIFEHVAPEDLRLIERGKSLTPEEVDILNKYAPNRQQSSPVVVGDTFDRAEGVLAGDSSFSPTTMGDALRDLNYHGIAFDVGRGDDLMIPRQIGLLGESFPVSGRGLLDVMTDTISPEDRARNLRAFLEGTEVLDPVTGVPRPVYHSGRGYRGAARNEPPNVFEDFSHWGDDFAARKRFEEMHVEPAVKLDEDVWDLAELHERFNPEGVGTYKSWLSMKNPEWTGDLGIETAAGGTWRGDDMFDHLLKYYGPDSRFASEGGKVKWPEGWEGFLRDSDAISRVGDNIFSEIDQDMFQAFLAKQGKDGIIYRNAAEGGTGYIPFSSKQIKSAIGNEGTFDPSNPNILKSALPLGGAGLLHSLTEEY